MILALNLFPPHTHLLTLVSDPDRMLAGEKLMSELAQRGFVIIQEDDPVLLRHRVEAEKPFTLEHPILVITSGPLEDLPYDLYEPAHRLALSLHQYFPNLAYPVLQTLTPDQLELLAACHPPSETLGRQKTIDYLLREVFKIDLTEFAQPSALVAWLSDYHHQQSSLSTPLRAALVERLNRISVYNGWDLDRLIRDPQAFSDFIQQEWQISIEQTIEGEKILETISGYHLAFDRDPRLQDLLPALVRRGILQPLEVSAQKSLPAWSNPGITRMDVRLQRLESLLADLESRVKSMRALTPAQTNWGLWTDFARDWAELCSLEYQSGIENNTTQKVAFRRLTHEVDTVFSAWLLHNYSSLGTQRLPKPHHVYHIPHYLAYLHSLGKIKRVVLIVLDGLSLTDWLVIQSAWTKSHKDWEFRIEPLLAQVPTITSISRYALISGLRPADFAGDLNHCPPEARAWDLFWSREGIPDSACELMAVSLDRGIDQMPELQDPRINFWCLIDDTPDKLAHNATLGAADQQASLRLWLDPAQVQNSKPLEGLIDSYLEREYSVFIASDHGHVEATGIGQPNEGLLAQTRGKRARIYSDRQAALRVQSAFPDTILWDNDGILPDQMAALMPSKREAFTPSGEVVVTHGGISIEEAMVPFIRIKKVSA